MKELKNEGIGAFTTNPTFTMYDISIFEFFGVWWVRFSMICIVALVRCRMRSLQTIDRQPSPEKKRGGLLQMKGYAKVSGIDYGIIAYLVFHFLYYFNLMLKSISSERRGIPCKTLLRGRFSCFLSYPGCRSFVALPRATNISPILG